jgi:ABC-type Fe3+ transport system permease subunit
MYHILFCCFSLLHISKVWQSRGKHHDRGMQWWWWWWGWLLAVVVAVAVAAVVAAVVSVLARPFGWAIAHSADRDSMDLANEHLVNTVSIPKNRFAR